MKSATARVIPFDKFPHENFAAIELHAPKVARNLDEAVKQVRPLFMEWIAADTLFEKNTLEVAKAIARVWNIYNASEEKTSRVGFARLFDTKIPDGAKTRDVENNATYNKLNYLLYKVLPAGEGAAPAISAKQRAETRQRALRADWRAFEKYWDGNKEVSLDYVKAAVSKMIARFVPAKQIEKIFAA